jgi:CubicO group peptidase (beta-lactamase class C family)
MSKIRWQANIMVIVLLLLFVSGAASQTQNPQQHWQQYKTPEEAGFSSEKIAEAKKLYDTLDAAAFMVVYRGKVLISWGDVERRYQCHSVRKSLLSAVYGTHVDEGTIDLDKTLEELNIDDQFPLSKQEKQARIRDLLKARSGVYHPAAYETRQMKERRPKRGSYKRDTFWYYNNWDFNTLCTILEQETKTDFFQDFKTRIADPIGMEDFRLIDGYHHLEPENSNHPAYPFRLSARDLARFAQLYLQEGKWNDRRLISGEWIKESTRSYSCAGDNMAYGYLWWIYHDFDNVGGMYAALGVGTQVAAVLPGADMVIVQRVDTYKGKSVRPDKNLLRMILEARVSDPKPNPELIPLQNTPSFTRPELTTLKPNVLKKYIKEYQMGDLKFTIKNLHGYLVVEIPGGQTYKLLPVSKTQFVVEDIEAYGFFELDRKGTPVNFMVFPSQGTAAFYADIVKMGPGPAVNAYKEKQKLLKDRYIFSETELNRMGYQLLGMKKMPAAIEVFKLNAELYPNSFNVYDSLGEAYMVNGDMEKAIFNYKKSLELNPRNNNAVDKLKELEAKKNE